MRNTMKKFRLMSAAIMLSNGVRPRRADEVGDLGDYSYMQFNPTFACRARV
jgi:hypothetical protein